MPNEGHGSVKKHSLVRKSEFKTSCGTKRKAPSGTNSSVPVDVEKLVHKSEKGAWIPIYGDTTDENVNQPLEKCDSSKKQFSEEDVKELLRVFLKEFRDDVSHKNDTQQEKEIAIMRTRKTQKTTIDEPPVAKIKKDKQVIKEYPDTVEEYCESGSDAMQNKEPMDEKKRRFFISSVRQMRETALSQGSSPFIVGDLIARVSFRMRNAFRDSLSKLNSMALEEVAERVRMSYSVADVLYAIVLAHDVYDKRIESIPCWETSRKKLLSDAGTLGMAKESLSCLE